MIFNCLHCLVRIQDGVSEAVILGLYFFISCIYGLCVYIVFNVVATNFIDASSKLDIIDNPIELILQSRQLIEKFRKLKSGMSSPLFIYCICFTVMLLNPTYFMVLNIRNNVFDGALFYGIFSLYVLTLCLDSG